MSKMPPVPPANRSKSGPGDKRKANTADKNQPHDNVDPEHRGQQANSRINTTHQGHQQDR